MKSMINASNYLKKQPAVKWDSSSACFFGRAVLSMVLYVYPACSALFMLHLPGLPA